MEVEMQHHGEIVPARDGESAVDIVGHLILLREGGTGNPNAQQARSSVALFADGLRQGGYPLGGSPEQQIARFRILSGRLCTHIAEEDRDEKAGEEDYGFSFDSVMLLKN